MVTEVVPEIGPVGQTRQSGHLVDRKVAGLE